MEKGFKTLELIGDLDDKYIYEASKPWKKQHRFFHIQRSWKTAVAGIILLIMVGCTLRYQEEDRKSTRLNSSHTQKSRMPSSA